MRLKLALAAATCGAALWVAGHATLGFAAPNAGVGAIRGAVKVQRMGKAKADASGVVVYVVGFEQPPPKTIAKLGQRKKQFERRLLAITAGQRVDFPNLDRFFHNVFSLSKARRFDLGQYKNGRSKSKGFPRKGIVEVYCNIHPSMSATIMVLPNRAFAMTDKTGGFSIAGVPPGSWTVYAYSRHAKRPTRVTHVVVKAGGVTVVSGLTLNETLLQLKHKNKYGQEYRDRSGRYR
ncbi:MAG: hypothetical protein KC502_10060 [Myxococcales bacterium]|nr:hypothetical protein [Myxococcales bacterium]